MGLNPDFKNLVNEQDDENYENYFVCFQVFNFNSKYIFPLSSQRPAEHTKNI
jgi:hypothetical protein